MSKEILDRAAQIASRSGIDKKDAIRVAQGRVTVQQVLKEMMFQEKVASLVNRYGLERSVACNVARGEVELDRALLLKGLKDCPCWNPDRSILKEFNESGAEGIFYMFGRKPFKAKVHRVDKYDLWFSEAGGEPAKTEKHNILMACKSEDGEGVDRIRVVDEEVKGKGLGPSVSYRDRFRSSKRVLYQYHRDKRRARVTMRDGSVLEGAVEWFGKWEFGLDLDGSAKCVVFRHAMHRLDAVEPRRGKGKSGSGRRRKKK